MFFTLLMTILLVQQLRLISWGGRVTSVGSDAIQAKSGPQGTLTNLKITLASGGIVWKRTNSNTLSAIHVGDEIVVRGFRTSESDLAATQIWVNLTKLNGHVASVSGNQFALTALDEQGNVRGDTVTVTVYPDTKTCLNSPFSITAIQKGTDVEVIGTRLQGACCGCNCQRLRKSRRGLQLIGSSYDHV